MPRASTFYLCVERLADSSHSYNPQKRIKGYLINKLLLLVGGIKNAQSLLRNKNVTRGKNEVIDEDKLLPLIFPFWDNVDSMKLLSEEKSKLLAQRHGWSIARAEGFVEGETCRTRVEVVSIYRRVGIDDFAVGFREGYFLRESHPATPSAIAPGAA